MKTKKLVSLLLALCMLLSVIPMTGITASAYSADDTCPDCGEGTLVWENDGYHYLYCWNCYTEFEEHWCDYDDPYDGCPFCSNPSYTTCPECGEETLRINENSEEYHDVKCVNEKCDYSCDDWCSLENCSRCNPSSGNTYYTCPECGENALEVLENNEAEHSAKCTQCDYECILKYCCSFEECPDCSSVAYSICPWCGETTLKVIDSNDSYHNVICINSGCAHSCQSNCSYEDCTHCHRGAATLDYAVIDEVNKYACVYAKDDCLPFEGELVIPGTCTIEGQTYTVTTINSWGFNKQTSMTSVVIPDSVTSIEPYAFAECSDLVSITIPAGVTNIDVASFNRCTSLTNVTIPEGLTNLGNGAFNGCRSLTSVTIPDGITSIPDHAFSGCKSLTSVTISGSVTSIDAGAFNEVSLDNVTFETDDINNITFQIDSFNITLPTELNKKATVKICGFNNNLEVNNNVRNGQLLKPVLEGYTGSTELYYQFTTDDSYANKYLTFYTSNLKDVRDGKSSSIIYKSEAYAAIETGDTPTKLTCNVYEPVLTNGKLSINLIATVTYDNPMCSLDKTEMLEAEFSENNVVLMQEGDEATGLADILGKAGFTHLGCSNVHFNSVTKAEGDSVTVSGSNITPVNAGLSEITFTCYTTGCMYHSTAGSEEYPVEATIYIYVAEKPTITATTNSITVTDNTTSPAESTYRIGLTNTGTVNGEATTFTGLNSETEYDVIQELKLTIDEKDYTGYYHNYISTEADDIIPEEIASATYSASLTLNENIDVNFKMKDIPEADADKLEIYINGTEQEFTLTDGTTSAMTVSVSPENMGDDIHFVIVYDGVTVKDFNYSVKSYCEAVFKANTDGQYDTLADLCEALLNYGKYAEDYDNGNTDSTVNEGHAKDFANYTVTQETPTPILGDYAEEASASLELGSTVKLNYVLTGCTVALNNDNEDSQNFYVLNQKGEQITPSRVDVSGSDGNYTVSIDLYATQLANTYTLVLKGVSESKFAVTYGVYHYCAAVIEGDYSETVQTLCKAIHNYSEAVQAYIDR